MALSLSLACVSLSSICGGGRRYLVDGGGRGESKNGGKMTHSSFRPDALSKRNLFQQSEKYPSLLLNT